MASEDVIETFRQYLKIPSVHPDPNYDECVAFLKKKADKIGLETKVLRLDENHPVLIISLKGTEQVLPSILLNSHMDVVPVFKEGWTHDPFGAEMDDEGNIYGRGAQDMKCVTIAQLEALRRIKSSKVKLRRTVHMTILPDEEIGSEKGMKKFVQTQTFRDLNIGFDLDEGTPSDSDEFNVYGNERSDWGVLVHCPGTTGHGSLLFKDTAGEKLRVVLDHFMDRRAKEAECSEHRLLGDITTINLTLLQGGIQNNVVPPEIVAGFDIRLAGDADHSEIEKWINEVCKKAGEGVYPEYIQKEPKVPATDLTSTNPFWNAIESVFKSIDLNYVCLCCFGATDARFARGVGVPAVGFTPFNKTNIRLHANDEYLNKEIFIKGVSIYEKLIQHVANV